MSSHFTSKSECGLSKDDEIYIKESRRLYSSMFGKHLDDTDETPSLICDRLFLGSGPDARNFDKLQRHGIKYVLNMTGLQLYGTDFFTTSGHSYVTLLSLDSHDVDNYDISAHFPGALNFIHRSLQAGDGAVLVHCAGGISRSATIVAAYLMDVHHIGAAEAIMRVHQARPCVCPNLGFLRQLLRFENSGFKFK